jgi:hypothetical protein
MRKASAIRKISLSKCRTVNNRQLNYLPSDKPNILNLPF